MAIRYQMIPHIPEDTTYFHAGPLTIGVESRFLSDVTSAATIAGQGRINLETLRKISADFATGNQELKDGGVSIHVFGEVDNDLVEYLRFDCFKPFPIITMVM